MKNFLLFAFSGLLLLLSWTACHEENDTLPDQEYNLRCSQDSTFYYYTFDYDRIYLVVSDYSITLKFSDHVTGEYQDQLVEQTGAFDSVSWIREDKHWAYGYLKAGLSCEDIEALLVSLVEEDQVVCANPNFYLKETVDRGMPVNVFEDLMGLTDEFVVKPKDGVPWSVIESLLNATRTRLVSNSPFYLVLSADKRSAGNSLEMSKFFYETGYFEFSHPNFLMTIVFFK
jgi:hypothetical protein